MFSDLNKLESELMDMMNDHIRLVQFGYDGELENIHSLLRSEFKAIALVTVINFRCMASLLTNILIAKALPAYHS